MKPVRWVKLSRNVVFDLPRPLVEYPKETWMDLYGKRTNGGLLVRNSYAVSSTKRLKHEINLSVAAEKRLLEYDALLDEASREDYKIGGAHAHSRKRPCVLSDIDIAYIKSTLEKLGLQEWLEIVLWLDDTGPNNKIGLFYSRRSRRPRIKILTEGFGIDVTYIAYMATMGEELTVQEVPVHFERSVFEEFTNFT